MARARDRRALLIGGGAIVAGLIVLRGVPAAVSTVSTLQDQVLAQAALLQSARRQIARGELLSDSLDLLREAVGRVSQQLLEAGAAEDAAAELTRRITVGLSRHPVRLDAVRSLSDSAAQMPGRIRAVVVFEGDVRGVASAMRELETDSRIVLHGIDLVANNPSIGSARVEVLRVEVEVGAFFVAGEAGLPAPDSTRAGAGDG